MLIYAPDATDVAPEILTAVSGIPTMRGYRSPPIGGSSLISALEAAPIGGSVVITVTGAQSIFVGTGSKLFKLVSGAWSNVSRTGNYTVLGNPAAGYRWRFAAFGEKIYAATGPKTLFGSVSTAVPLQSFGASTFSDISGPAATCIATVGNFLMLGGTYDGTFTPNPGFGTQNNRWWCSRLNDAESIWTPSVTTQCTSGLLVATPGEITAIADLMGRCVIYKNSSIYVGNYVGPPEVWVFDVAAQDVGTYTQEAVVNVGTKHYFIGANDIYEFDGSRPIPIGAGVREWFFARITKAGLAKIQSLHDQNTQTIYWFYPANGSSTLDAVLVYNYATNRFGAFNFAVSEIIETIGGSSATAEGGISVDELNRFYMDGSYVTKALTTAGTALTLTTGWYGDEFLASLCSRVKPKFRTAPSGGTCTPSSCMHIGGTITTGSAQSISNGFFDILQSARYHRFALSLTGDTEIEVVRPQIAQESEE